MCTVVSGLRFKGLGDAPFFRVVGGRAWMEFTLNMQSGGNKHGSLPETTKEAFKGVKFRITAYGVKTQRACLIPPPRGTLSGHLPRLSGNIYSSSITHAGLVSAECPRKLHCLCYILRLENSAPIASSCFCLDLGDDITSPMQQPEQATALVSHASRNTTVVPVSSATSLFVSSIACCGGTQGVYLDSKSISPRGSRW